MREGVRMVSLRYAPVRATSLPCVTTCGARGGGSDGAGIAVALGAAPGAAWSLLHENSVNAATTNEARACACTENEAARAAPSGSSGLRWTRAAKTRSIACRALRSRRYERRRMQRIATRGRARVQDDVR